MNPNDRLLLSEAVASAEQKTSAEIVTIIAKSTETNLVRDFNLGMVVGFQGAIVLVLLQSLLWLQSPSIFSWVVMGVLLLFVFSTISFLKYMMGRVQKDAVLDRAKMEFQRSVISRTVGATGVLLFFSEKERQLVILADEAIDKKVEEKTWDKIVNKTLDVIKKEDLTQGVKYCIESVGEVCSQHCPIQPGDVNEISNEVEIKD